MNEHGLCHDQLHLNYWYIFLSAAPPCKEKLCVMFVIDKSYSIHEELFQEARQLAHDTADILFDNAPNVKLGALVFDGFNNHAQYTDVPSQFHQELDSLVWPTYPYTALDWALIQAHSLGMRSV